MNSLIVEKFGTWAKPLSDTEDEKCENAEGMVRKAIDASTALKTRSIRVFTQGSYRNNTNVRADSDVDIAVCCRSLINADYSFAPHVDDQKAGLVDSTYSSAQLRIDVGDALRSYFGSSQVNAGSKAFDVHSNSYRVDADVVPCVEHRRYQSTDRWLTGTTIYPTSGGRIVNWPQQNYDNGAAKNLATNANFKRLVRIIKNLRNYMAEEGYREAEPIPSYLIECLVWQVPNEGFLHTSYAEDVQYILTRLYNETRNDDSCREWGEINELKYLFRSSQPWNRMAVNDFVYGALSVLGMH
jgi:hypothetical protein